MDGYMIDHEKLTIDVVEGDYTDARQLEALNLERFSNIILLTNDWIESEEESDARSIMGYLLLQNYFKEKDKRPNIVLELANPDNEDLFSENRSNILVSTHIVGHILARSALKPENKKAYSSLLNNKWCEIVRVGADQLSLELDRSYYAPELIKHCNSLSLTFLGVAHSRGIAHNYDLKVNPKNDELIKLSMGDKLLVLDKVT